MGLTDKSGSSFAVNGLNAIFRLLQLAFGAIALGIAEAKSHAMWTGYKGNEISLGVAIGVISILTAIIFGIIPFLVSYYYVAVAFLWDWIVFFIWCGAFATERKIFGDANTVAFIRSVEFPSVDALIAGQWICLGGMLVQLMSAIMGPVCLLLDRKSLRASRAVA